MKTIYKKLLFLLLLLPVAVLAQTLEGTVVDKMSKQPLPGVNVVIQGAANGAQTDFDGKYSIKASPNETLVFSYIGMKNENLIAKSTSLNVKRCPLSIFFTTTFFKIIFLGTGFFATWAERFSAKKKDRQNIKKVNFRIYINLNKLLVLEIQ